MKTYNFILNECGQFGLVPSGRILLSQWETGSTRFAFTLPDFWANCTAVTIEYMLRGQPDTKKAANLVKQKGKFCFDVNADFTRNTGRILFQLVGKTAEGAEYKTLLDACPVVEVKISVNAGSFEENPLSEVVDILNARLTALENAPPPPEVDLSPILALLEEKADRTEVDAVNTALESKADTTALESKADATAFEELQTIVDTHNAKAEAAALNLTRCADRIWQGGMGAVESFPTRILNIGMTPPTFVKYKYIELTIDNTAVYIPSIVAGNTINAITGGEIAEGEISFTLVPIDVSCERLIFTRGQKVRLLNDGTVIREIKDIMLSAVNALY